MPLATLLRKELRRIARLEIKPVAARLRKATRQLSQLRRLLRAQRRALGALSVKAGARPRRRLALSATRRAVLRLQGQYMGHLRGLTQRGKARVKARRAAGGLGAAISLAKKLRR